MLWTLLKILISKWHIGICDGLIYITFLKLRFVYFLFSVVICADDIGSGNFNTSPVFPLINIFGSKTSLG